VDAIPVRDGFRYASDTNPQWLSGSELEELLAPAVHLPTPAAPAVQAAIV